MTHKEITERLQEILDNQWAASPKGAPTLGGIQKLSNGNIKITALCKEEADILYNDIEWNEAFEGLEVHYPTQGIVVHGVPKTDITIGENDDVNTEAIQHLRDFNNIPIMKIATLQRRVNPNTSHQSIIVFTDRSSAAICLQHGLRINYRLYTTTEPYSPQFQLTQCFNCYKYGHRAAECRNKSTCGKCASINHKANDCSSNAHSLKCSNCSGNHEAWNTTCPIKITERQKCRELRKDSILNF